MRTSSPLAAWRRFAGAHPLLLALAWGTAALGRTASRSAALGCTALIGVALLNSASARGDSFSAPVKAQLKVVLSKTAERATLDQRSKIFELYERHNSQQRWYLPPGFLDDEAGDEWLKEASVEIDEAYAHFKKASVAGLLPDCTRSLQEPRALDTIILVDRLGSDASERQGELNLAYNAGPVIETHQWRPQAAKRLILHELTHLWCHSKQQSTYGKWLEEGVADWVAFAQTGDVPQADLTRYLENPCQPTLYGSSFLWVLSRMVPYGNRELLLAQLHLGVRNHLGAQINSIEARLAFSPAPACDAAALPVVYGHIEAQCPTSPTPTETAVPLRNHGEFLGCFVWSRELQ